MKTPGAFAIALIFAVSASAQWIRQENVTTAGLRGLSVVSERVVWASGTGGVFVRTVDGGKTWTGGVVPGAEKLDFRDVEAFDENTAYLLSIGNGESSRIYRTDDGGRNWRLQFKNKDESAFFDAFAFWDRNNGIAMSDPVGGKYLLFSTADGENWRPMDTEKMAGTRQGEAAFAASGTCIVTKGSKSVYLVTGGTDARVFRSVNRGASWLDAGTPMAKGTAGSGIFSIAVFDALNAVIVGGNYEKPDETAGTLAFTRNGGKTWTAGSGLSGYRSGVAYIDRTTIIAVGTNGSDLSTDGGATWRRLDSENYNAVAASGNTVWAVGPKGLISRAVIETAKKPQSSRKP
jgi:photosystem II stability/assembly factor-like uncharacterized protein